MIFDWHTILGVFSSGILILLVYPYVLTILRGTTRPNIVSWGGWSFLAGIATAVQFSQGASWSVMIPLITTVSGAIVALSAIRLGYVRITKIELICVGLALLSLILWLFAQAPLLSLVLIILADLFITIPTFVKTFRAPNSEPAPLWFIYTLAASLGIIATTKYDIYNLLYPCYVALGAGVITLLALRDKVKKYRG